MRYTFTLLSLTRIFLHLLSLFWSEQSYWFLHCHNHVADSEPIPGFSRAPSPVLNWMLPLVYWTFLMSMPQAPQVPHTPNSIHILSLKCDPSSQFTGFPFNVTLLVNSICDPRQNLAIAIMLGPGSLQHQTVMLPTLTQQCPWLPHAVLPPSLSPHSAHIRTCTGGLLVLVSWSGSSMTQPILPCSRLST